MSNQIVIPLPPRAQDLSGQTFGRLTVLAYAGNRNNFGHWWCCCSCGADPVPVRASSLKNGHTISCGCAQREKAGAIAVEYLTKHGHSKSSGQSLEFKVWASMRARCYQKNNPAYHRYGGRGIRISQAWLDSFASFYKDMGPLPSRKHTIERIDNDGNYETSNCRWATRKEQARNTRRNHRITFNGQTKTLVEWSECIGIDQDTLGARFARGWSVEKCLKTPLLLNQYHHAKPRKQSISTPASI